MKFPPWIALGLLAAALPVRATDEWLDRLDESLTVASPGGQFRARLSGLVDAEGYRFSQVAPELIDTNSRGLFNPRLTLLVDAQLGPAVYLFIQARADRGYDASDERARMRLDEYALRFTPWDDGRLNIQVGKFSTVVGNWTSRHLSWDNPFITEPLPYGAVTAASDLEVPASAAEFGHFAAAEKYEYLPVIWGANYTSGVSVSGQLGPFDYAAEVKNAPLSSRPQSWDASEIGFAHPTVSGRLGLRPNPAWTFGVSASRGAFLRPEAVAELPRGRHAGDFQQSLLGADVSFAQHHWQFWGELYLAEFDVPRVGRAQSLTYYVEGKYKFTPQLFGALRWGQQFYAAAGEGDATPGPDRWQVDASLGYRLTAHTQLKVQYSLQRGEIGAHGLNQVWATQFTLRF